MDDKYIGKLLDGRYEILDIAGVGGMAVVYKARDRALNRYVAIKVLKEEFAQDEEFRRRFHNESQTVARLSHHNIVSIYDVSQTEGLNYIVMELVDGISLKEYLQEKGRLTWQEALFFAQQIARALEHAHSRGIIHQDIKPHNIMILRDATAKVTDFGIARFAAKEETQVVKEAIGSVHYISPEQARGSTIDYRTDLYSLGVVMYEMLTGRLPFDGDNALAIVMQHISAMPLMPSEIVPSIPNGMNEIVMHAMSPTLNRRYSSASELYADLERLKSDPNMTFHYNIESRGEAIESEETQKLPNFEVLNNIPIHHTPAVRPQAEYSEKPVVPARREASRSNIYEERRTAPKPNERSYEQPSHNPRRRHPREDEDDGRFGDSPLLMVAVALLAIALIGGVAFFWFARFWGEGTKKVEVPSFLGAVYTDVLNDSNYSQFQFRTEGRLDDTKPADTVIDQNPSRGTMVEENATITLYYAMEDDSKDDEEDIRMEDFRERDLQVAISFLKEKGIKYTVEHDFDDTIEEGRIIRTTPRSGQTILPDEEVLLVVSDGPDDGPFEMPDYYREDIEAAKDDLLSRGLVLKTSEPRDTNMPKNQVVAQEPEAGATVQKGDEVSLYYSSGSKPEDTTKPVEPDTQDPDEAVGTGSIAVTLPPVPGEAQVIIEMSGNTIWNELYDTSLGTAIINGLEGSIGTHDVVVTIIPVSGGESQNYETSITFS